MSKLKNVIFTQKEGFYYASETETLCTLESKFKTTKRLISLDNNLTTAAVSNRWLYIKNYGETYTIKPTDTIKNLQEKFAVSIEELYKINKVNYFYPGQVIIIKYE